MLLRYQIEGVENSEWNITEIPDKMIHDSKISLRDITTILEDDQISTEGHGFSVKYYDHKNDGWRKATIKCMIPATDEVRIRVKLGNVSEA